MDRKLDIKFEKNSDEFLGLFLNIKKHMNRFIIDNTVVTKNFPNGIHICRVSFMKKINPTIDINAIPIITYGDRLKDAQVIRDLSNGILTFEDLVPKDLQEIDEPFCIFIKFCMSGKIIVVSVKKTSTIMELKEKLLDKEGILPSRQNLLFEGIVLDDNKTLLECNIKKNGTLFLVTRG